jgi:hypothetical protein
MNPIRTVRLMMFLVIITLLGGSVASAENAPYVGAYQADTFFPTITSNEMAVIKTKKILFLSRSFGLNMRDGLTDLKNQNSMYDILSSYVNYDVMNQGLGTVATNAFANYNFVHCMATYWPHTKRLEEVNTLLRDPPYSFGSKVDVVMVYWHYALESVFDTYTNTFDKLQADFPNIKFVYVTAGFMDTNHVTENTASAAFSAKVRAKYQGKAPLYDLGHILNNDTDLLGYLPEYSTDSAGVHPNVAFAEQRMGKAFLLMLRDLYFGSGCTNLTPPTVPVASGSALSSTSIKITWPASTHECGISRYEVTRNGTSIGSVTQTNYTDSGLTENTAYNYAVRAVSMADVLSAYSSTTTVTTLADSVAPTVVKATSLSSSQISVEFSENMDSVSAQTATNYVMNNGVTVLSASLSGKMVTLSVSDMVNGAAYTLTISNVKDASSAKNPVAAGTQAVFTYEAVTYPSDPTAYWSFNGNLNDASGNGLNGTWVSGSASYSSGLLGYGLVMNGSTSVIPVTNYMKVNHNSLLDGMPALSISIWAKKNDTLAGGELFRKHTVYSLAINTNSLKGNVTTTAGAANFTVAAVSGVNDTNWHHYCLVYNGTNVLAYVDGTQRNSMAKSGNVTNVSASYISIGRNDRNAPYYAFAGDLDEMKLFRRALSTNEINALVSAGVGGKADRAAVRTLLDANNLTNKQVDAISVYDKDRITKLYLQESGVSNITADIGQLSELNLLHVYGDRALPYPLLSQVSSGIGSCTKMTELLLSQNSLTNLPVTITNLTKLTICSIGDNFLCEADPAWENWADTFDSDWRATQDCPSSLFYIYSILSGPGSVFPTNRLAVSAGQSTQLVYSANTWHELTGFLGNGASVPAAVGRPAYTAVYANVSADITNAVTFTVIKASADGQTPATWYGPLGANPAVADEDQDSLSLNQEYLINSNPAQSNAFQMISAGLDSERRISLSWRGLGLPNGQIEIGLQTDLNGAFTYPAGTAVYSNGVCTWRSDSTLTNRTGFVRLRINSIP